MDDKFTFLKYEKKINNFSKNKLSPKDRDAFKIMELEPCEDWLAVQKKFKSLVKQYHPDKNAGNKQYEDKLKKITLAYSHLKVIMVKK